MRSRTTGRISERRLDAIIVAATLAVIVIAVLALVALVEPVAPHPGDGPRDVAALAD